MVAAIPALFSRRSCLRRTGVNAKMAVATSKNQGTMARKVALGVTSSSAAPAIPPSRLVATIRRSAATSMTRISERSTQDIAGKQRHCAGGIGSDRRHTGEDQRRQRQETAAPGHCIERTGEEGRAEQHYMREQLR